MHGSNYNYYFLIERSHSNYVYSDTLLVFIHIVTCYIAAGPLCSEMGCNACTRAMAL